MPEFDTQAEFYDYKCRKMHKHPNLMDKDVFLAYDVSWFKVAYNEQGYLFIDFIIFQDQSIYSKGSGPMVVRNTA